MNIDNLKSYYTILIKDEKDSINYLSDENYNKHNVIFSLIGENVRLAVCSIFIDKDIPSAKNHFYKSASILSYLHNKYERGNYTSNIFLTHNGFCYALLSDNTKLIDNYLKYEDDFLRTFNAAFAKALQFCILDKPDNLQHEIKLLEKLTNKKSIAKYYSGVVSAF